MNDIARIAGPWTSRDLDILEVLALKTRFMTAAQIASIWWRSSRTGQKHTRRRLLELSRSGLISRYSITAHPVLEMQGPVCGWTPGMPSPNPATVAYRLQSRWSNDSIGYTVYAASRVTANLFASNSGKLPPPVMWTHDLHVSEVYRLYRLNHPAEASLWLGEDAFGKAGNGVKDPDAFLVSENGDRLRVIDFGGRYDAERVLDFHLHCSDRGLEYELW